MNLLKLWRHARLRLQLIGVKCFFTNWHRHLLAGHEYSIFRCFRGSLWTGIFLTIVRKKCTGKLSTLLFLVRSCRVNVPSELCVSMVTRSPAHDMQTNIYRGHKLGIHSLPHFDLNKTKEQIITTWPRFSKTRSLIIIPFSRFT